MSPQPADSSDDLRWRHVLESMTTFGSVSSAHQIPAPTDKQLWAMAQRYGLSMGDRIDAGRLGQLWTAFLAGYDPDRFDLQTVADLVAERAMPVQLLGGSRISLYTGRSIYTPAGEVRHLAIGGPGWVDERDGRLYARRGTFVVGPDTDHAWIVTVAREATVAQISDLVVAVSRAAEDQYLRYVAAIDAARGAALAVLAAGYPQADTTALVEGPCRDVTTALATTLSRWLSRNPPGRPGHLDTAVSDHR